jgi:hypothetical protein
MIGHSFGAFLAQESVQVRGRFERGTKVRIRRAF